MEDYKLIATPMITNLKKVTTSYSKVVDPMLYRKLIDFFMYLVNTKPYILFCSEYLESIHGRVKTGALDRSKTCAQVFEGHNGEWFEISWRW
jgi:hypothetical protein